jgi:uncharacterized iron-regulated protein
MKGDNVYAKFLFGTGLLTAVACLGVLTIGQGCASTGTARSGGSSRLQQWVNVVRGEPVTFEELLDELQEARVIYLGEHHTIPRHHALQVDILNGLAARGIPLVLAMEQFEYFTQPVLDRYNGGEADLGALVAGTDWAHRWRGHTNYLDLLSAAKAHRVPLLALNARAETIRAVGRQGLDGITAEQRAELPDLIHTNDPVYETLMTRILGVHMAFDPDKLRPVFQAQVARDETMAARLSSYLTSPAGEGRMALVICGRGHCEFGLGMPDRVALRMPDAQQRVVLFSQSGDLELSEAERAQAREIEIPHQFLRDLGRLPADFLHVTEPARR